MLKFKQPLSKTRVAKLRELERKLDHAYNVNHRGYLLSVDARKTDEFMRM